MSPAEILLVEDDQTIGESLSRAIRSQGYDVDWMTNGRDALQHADVETRLVVLDLGLPDVDGLEVCRALRKRKPGPQILVLTARQEEVDIVVALDAGADDYLAKPFRLAELLARIRARLRQGESTASSDGLITIGTLRIDLKARQIFQDGSEVELRPKEFDLLALLATNVGTVVSREDVMAQVWDENWFGSTKTLDIHISALRRKLDLENEPSSITTLRGVGYRFEQRLDR